MVFLPVHNHALWFWCIYCDKLYYSSFVIPMKRTFKDKLGYIKLLTYWRIYSCPLMDFDTSFTVYLFSWIMSSRYYWALLADQQSPSCATTKTNHYHCASYWWPWPFLVRYDQHLWLTGTLGIWYSIPHSFISHYWGKENADWYLDVDRFPVLDAGPIE